jgi:hypothetical protein
MFLGLRRNDSSYGLKRKPTRSLLRSLQQSKVSSQGKLKIPAKSPVFGKFRFDRLKFLTVFEEESLNKLFWFAGKQDERL